jgi:hypothetical protein
VNCHAVDRWLDDGSPEAGRVAALAHVRSCPRCAAALAAAEALETALAAAPPAAPPGFTDRVMAQVAAAAPVRARIPVMELLPLLQTFPWWVRLALEPASLLAALLAAVLVWRGDALFALATGGALQLAAWLAQAAPASAAAAAPAGAPAPLAAMLLQPTVLTCLVLGAAPLVLMGSRLLYGWSATLVGPRHLRLRAH